jgi:hypothetical protein
MSALSLRLPESLHEAARELAAQDGVSVNQFITTAVAEKIAVLRTVEYLKRRAEGAQPGDVDFILSRVPSVPPEPYDRLPESLKS